MVWTLITIFGCSQATPETLPMFAPNVKTGSSLQISALMKAIENHDIEGVKQSLSSGMNVNMIDKSKLSPLSLAASKGYSDIVVMLLKEGADVLMYNENEHGTFPLVEAAAKGEYDTVKLLLVQGAEIDQRDKYGDPALNWATYHGHQNVVELLIDEGAELTLVGSGGGTALGTAIQQKHIEIEEVLRKAGAKE